MKLFGVFGYPKLGVDELLGVYSTPERAQALIDAQLPELRMGMRVEEIVVDQDPDDEFWRKPNAASSAIAELEAQVARMVRESGRPEGFDAKQWLQEWLTLPQAALGGKRPDEFLGTEEGQRTLSDLLAREQSGAYS
jgi:hypothetical protein